MVAAAFTAAAVAAVDTGGRAALSRIVMIVAGTEGDVSPNVALGHALAGRGPEVVLVANAGFEGLARSAGIGFAPLTADLRSVMAAERERLDGKPAIVVAWMGLRAIRVMARCWVEETLPVARGADLVIGSGLALYFASTLAEALGIAFVRTVFQPVEPSPEITPVMFRPPPFRLPGAVNLLLYAAMRELGWQLGRPVIGRLRVELGLGRPSLRGPWRSRWLGRAPMLNGFSAQVAAPSRAWGGHVATTGYWFLRSDEGPEDRLRAFVEAGPTPIYVGFGSMVARDADRLAGVIGRAVELVGCRAVILSGWGDVSAGLDRRTDMLVVRSVPHNWLLPRVRLAVHHGGAGTTAAVLRAGIPSVVVPFLFDQFYWAKRLQALGVAPARLRRRRLTPAALAGAIRQAGGSAMAEAAARLGERIRAEDGLGNAVSALQGWGVLA